MLAEQIGDIGLVVDDQDAESNEELDDAAATVYEGI
jgi:hypothetical protein